MQPEVQQNKNKKKGGFSPILTAAFMLALAVLGGISLRQYKQLQQLQQRQHNDLAGRSFQQNNLVRQLAGLQGQVRTNLKELAEQQKQISNKKNKTVENEQIRQNLKILHQQIENSRSQLDQIMVQLSWEEQIVDKLAGGTCLIQGEYIFLDPISSMPLRYVDQQPASNSSQSKQLFGPDTTDESEEAETLMPVSINGNGKTLVVQYTGTGFLVDEDGYVLTNRHVAAPWEVSQEYKHVIEAGYLPRLSLFVAYFPNQQKPFELAVMALSENEDMAVLYCNVGGFDIPTLSCQNEPDDLKVGQTLIVLGYPTGLDVLLARMPQQQLKEILGPNEQSFAQIAQNLADRQLIQPIATRGMCGRATQTKIVYDAETAIGGSGAPVLNSQGKVVGINTALLKGFAGTNIGIPVKFGMEMLEDVKKNAKTEQIAEKNASVAF